MQVVLTVIAGKQRDAKCFYSKIPKPAPLSLLNTFRFGQDDQRFLRAKQLKFHISFAYLVLITQDFSSVASSFP